MLIELKGSKTTYRSNFSFVTRNGEGDCHSYYFILRAIFVWGRTPVKEYHDWSTEERISFDYKFSENKVKQKWLPSGLISRSNGRGSDGLDSITDWYDQYGNDVYNFLIYRTGSTDVEDLVQETFLRAWRGMSGYRGGSKPLNWLFSIAKNVAADHVQKTHRVIGITQEFLESLPDRRDLPERAAELNDVQRRLWAVISVIKPPSYRDVIVCRGILDYSNAQTAQVLGWTEMRVRVTWHRALKKLRSSLEGMGLRYEELN